MSVTITLLLFISTLSIPSTTCTLTNDNIASAVSTYLSNTDSPYGPIAQWVTSMIELFSYTSFNGDIRAWDVSNVTSMRSMFWGPFSFHQDISDWDVSHVSNMRSMFASATEFNADISAWDVSRVTDMSGMFNSATGFHQTLCWDVGDIEMEHMFYNSTGRVVEYKECRVSSAAYHKWFSPSCGFLFVWIVVLVLYEYLKYGYIL